MVRGVLIVNGVNGEGLILFTASHELVHVMREGSPEHFKVLADFVVENYNKAGVSVRSLVLKQMGITTSLTYDQAYEEVIAQSCESMLRDVHLNDKAEALYKKSPETANKVKQILSNLYQKVKQFYAKLKPQSQEARTVLEMKDALSKMQDLFVEGINAATENLRNMKNTATEGDVKLQARGNNSSFNENAVSTAIWDALDHADQHHDNLIKVSEMPQYIHSLLGIGGDFYVQRNHTYENTVSEKQAKKEGRYNKNAHYHNYGVEKMERALLSIEHPIMTIATRTNDGNPTVIMLLDEFGNNDAPMYAVLSFYSNKLINGSNVTKPHVVLTVAEREWYAKDGRTGYDEIINNAIKENRVIDFDKSKRGDLTEVAQTTSLGSITESSLEHNLSQFKKEINSFKTKNKINYQSRDNFFDIDLFEDDDSVENIFAREYATHHEDIGEVLKNIEDIELPSKKVDTIVNRTIRDYLGTLDAETRRTLSTKLQIAMENTANPEQISNDMIAAVREAIDDATVTNERAIENYNDLRSVFKGNTYFLSDEQIADLAEHDMTLKDFKDKMRGRINIIKQENAQRSINGGCFYLSRFRLLKG